MGRRFFSLTHSRNIQQKAPSQKRVTVNRVQSFPWGKGTGAMMALPIPRAADLVRGNFRSATPTIEGTTVAQRSLLDSIARMPGRGDVGSPRSVSPSHFRDLLRAASIASIWS